MRLDGGEEGGEGEGWEEDYCVAVEEFVLADEEETVDVGLGEEA